MKLITEAHEYMKRLAEQCTQNGYRNIQALMFDRGEDDSVYDFTVSVAETNLGAEALDYARHGWRANVVFLDGHAETVGMGDASLKRVGLSAGIYR